MTENWNQIFRASLDCFGIPQAFIIRACLNTEIQLREDRSKSDLSIMTQRTTIKWWKTGGGWKGLKEKPGLVRLGTCMWVYLCEHLSPRRGCPGLAHPRWNPEEGCRALPGCYLYPARCSHVMSPSLLHKKTTVNQIRSDNKHLQHQTSSMEIYW